MSALVSPTLGCTPSCWREAGLASLPCRSHTKERCAGDTFSDDSLIIACPLSLWAPLRGPGGAEASSEHPLLCHFTRCSTHVALLLQIVMVVNDMSWHSRLHEWDSPRNTHVGSLSCVAASLIVSNVPRSALPFTHRNEINNFVLKFASKHGLYVACVLEFDLNFPPQNNGSGQKDVPGMSQKSRRMILFFCSVRPLCGTRLDQTPHLVRYRAI